MTMNRKFIDMYKLYSVIRFRSPVFFSLFFIILMFTGRAEAQIGNGANQLYYSQQFRLADGIIRIAEPGQLSDTLNVWGDINDPGRYMVPQGTTLPDMISYARGPNQYRTGETTVDWSKLRIEVNVSRERSGGLDKVTSFTYHYDKPLPPGMRDYVLKNNDVIGIQVKRKPSLADYLGIIAPVISGLATTILIIQRL